MRHDAPDLRLTDAEFRKISAFIEREFGIKMPPSKKALLQGRLHKRVAACGLRSYGAYFDFITDDPAGQDEFLHFIDLVSTHETSFFREPEHFRHLRGAIPSLYRRREDRELGVLSAACSTGEEAYTIAMTMDDALGDMGVEYMPFFVEGFDLSNRAVGIAARAVYEESRAKKIPPSLMRRYLMTSKRSGTGLCRIVPELRARMRFHTGNLLDDMSLGSRQYDIIFCRNVLIYFDRQTQARAVNRLIAHLRQDGYLYLGHAETMSSLDLPLRAITHAVYQLR